MPTVVVPTAVVPAVVVPAVVAPAVIVAATAATAVAVVAPVFVRVAAPLFFAAVSVAVFLVQQGLLQARPSVRVGVRVPAVAVWHPAAGSREEGGSQDGRPLMQDTVAT
mmetsp:Transcript_38606/g.120136  ORF Transcript_38606/g.120136 Transcript_38606/m.120136 type:complete len:109 (-) Transcript_38606:15-341(-)